MEVLVIGVVFEGGLILLNRLGVTALLDQVKTLLRLAPSVVRGGGGGAGRERGGWSGNELAALAGGAAGASGDPPGRNAGPEESESSRLTAKASHANGARFFFAACRRGGLIFLISGHDIGEHFTASRGGQKKKGARGLCAPRSADLSPLERERLPPLKKSHVIEPSGVEAE